eukprot:1693767-Amphidinium_carterae.1
MPLCALCPDYVLRPGHIFKSCNCQWCSKANTFQTIGTVQRRMVEWGPTRAASIKLAKHLM